MNKLIAFATALLLCSATYATAADTPPPAKKPAAAKVEKISPEASPACAKMGMGGGMGMGGMGMGMMGGMGAGMPTDFKQKMMEQMAAIRQTNDPAERQKLMEEHFQTMQEAMQSMRGTGGGMDGCGCCKQHGSHNMGGKPGCKKGDKCARSAGQGKMPQNGMMGGAMSGMMEQRMDMMQTMMENMLEHQRHMQQGK